MGVSHPGGSGFEGIKGSWRAAEVWHCERPGEAIGGGAASVAVEDPGLKGGMQKKLRFGTMKRAYESATQLQQRNPHSGDAGTMGRAPRTVAAIERSQLESRRQAVCEEGGAGEVTQALPRSPDNCE